ncbi:MAG TPA: hypothetical protein VNQ72_11105 [Candidatus Dormibacteraeota bacterium]|nr:hypothetical protein [Candidatus Dormibacteraeota bacterium]
MDDVHTQQGLSTAEYLLDRGRRVEVISRLFYAGQDVGVTSIAPLYSRLFAKGVTFTPHTDLIAVEGSAVVVANTYTRAERRLEAVDTVVLSMGSRSTDTLYRALKGKVPALHAIGDCVAPRGVHQAILRGPGWPEPCEADPRRPVMVVDIVYGMPSWILALVSICLVTAYALGGLVLVQRLVPAERRRPHNDLAGPVSGLVGVVFAVLIAFIAIAVWEQFGQASTLVLRESNAAGDVWRLAYGYPEPLRTQVRDGVRRYLETVIKEEWPQQAKGKTDGRAWRIFEDIHRAMLRFEPTTRGQEIIHADQLHDMNTIMDQRRGRLQAAREGISPQVWMVVLAGCALMIALTWFFGAESFVAHMGMTVCLSISIGLVIFLIAALDYPFRGDMGIGPEAFEEVLVNLDRLAADERAAQPR